MAATGAAPSTAVVESVRPAPAAAASSATTTVPVKGRKRKPTQKSVEAAATTLSDGAAAGSSQDGDVGKKARTSKQTLETKEKLCPWRSAEQQATQAADSTDVERRATSITMQHDGRSVTIKPGDQITRWASIKSDRKVPMLVFRLFKSGEANNWSALIREIDTDGPLLRFPVAEVITADAPRDYKDTSKERQDALHELDRRMQHKIDEEKQRKKATKKKATATPRRDVIPISSAHLNDISIFRAALKDELSPYAQMLSDAAKQLSDAAAMFDKSGAILTATVTAVNTFSQHLAGVAASK